eukprot:TRINITY_DN2965_c0_g2_i1.p1 TRINITY_DN2965_c0_g2~~TRINITY_DN2965_c0_g2_i1.p1  ORF type:complete len:717 (+),score=141.18 TRINITY_DN2965_c0_g2_i1:146-2296(+)
MADPKGSGNRLASIFSLPSGGSSTSSNPFGAVPFGSTGSSQNALSSFSGFGQSPSLGAGAGPSSSSSPSPFSTDSNPFGASASGSSPQAAAGGSGFNQISATWSPFGSPIGQTSSKTLDNPFGAAPNASQEKALLDLFSNADSTVAQEILKRVENMIKSGKTISSTNSSGSSAATSGAAAASSSSSVAKSPSASVRVKTEPTEPGDSRANSTSENSSAKKRKREEPPVEEDSDDCMIIEVKSEPVAASTDPPAPKRSKVSESSSASASKQQQPTGSKTDESDQTKSKPRRAKRAASSKQYERRDSESDNSSEEDDDDDDDGDADADDDDDENSAENRDWREGRTYDDSGAESADDDDEKNDNVEAQGAEAKLAKQSIDIINNGCPFFARMDKDENNYFFLTKVRFHRFFAGRAGWVFIEFRWHANGRSMNHSTLKKHFRRLYPEKASTDAFGIDVFGIHKKTIGWHPFSSIFPADIRRGEQLFDPESFQSFFLPNMPAAIVAQLKEIDPLQRLKTIGPESSPALQNLTKTVGMIKKHLPTMISGNKDPQDDEYAIWYDCEIDWETGVLKPVWEHDGELRDGFRDLCVKLQRRVRDENPTRSPSKEPVEPDLGQKEVIILVLVHPCKEGTAVVNNIDRLLCQFGLGSLCFNVIVLLVVIVGTLGAAVIVRAPLAPIAVLCRIFVIIVIGISVSVIIVVIILFARVVAFRIAALVLFG